MDVSECYESTRYVEEDSVSVIIPTTCETHRWPSLLRAINSAQSQARVTVHVIVVVNGDKYDPPSLDELRRRSDIETVYLEIANVAVAQRYGRSLVATAYFSFLDDDDEYLENTLDHRRTPMMSNPSIDFVVSNGYLNIDGVDHLCIDDPNSINEDPLTSLTSINWMASCAGLFRSSSVLENYFNGRTNYFEWTLLAYKLASTLSMRFVDVPTYRINDSAHSASKSKAYKVAQIGVLTEIWLLPLEPALKKVLRIKIAAANHDVVHVHMEEGNVRKAWRSHLASVFSRGGMKYLLFTRKLPLWKLAKAATRTGTIGQLLHH